MAIDLNVAVCGPAPATARLLRKFGVTGVYTYPSSENLLDDIRLNHRGYQLVLVHAPHGDLLLDLTWHRKAGEKDIPVMLVDEPIHQSLQILLKMKLEELSGQKILNPDYK